MKQLRFRSLRFRLLAPLLAAVVLTACGVALLSATVGGRRSASDRQARFEQIATALSKTSFPLTPPVLELLADLTQTELLILRGGDGRLIDASLPVDRVAAAELEQQLRRWAGPEATRLLTLDAHVYRGMRFRRRNGLSANEHEQVIILFDEQQLRQTRWQIAALPLVTGLTTTILLGTITLGLTGRLIRRLSQLERQVDQIATGAFDTDIERRPVDELGLLGASVQRMASQLKELWASVHRQQSQQLLHQIAGGMAHQLRNSLTGARMAIELHDSECSDRAAGSLDVAIQQIEHSEDFVRRLLQVGAGEQSQDRPACALQCLQDVQAGVGPVARHRQLAMQWQLPSALADWRVADGPSLTAAVSNLVLNALEAAQRVEVTASVQRATTAPAILKVQVCDDGPGIPAAVADRVFEPFVTSKQEGLGLGLAVVRRAIEKLHGEVHHQRDRGRTVFVLTLPLTSKAPV